MDHKAISWEDFERLYPNHPPLTEAEMLTLCESGSILVRVGDQPLRIDLNKVDA